MLKKLLHQPFFIKLLHWEYWPFHFVYAPVYLYWIWLAFRSRSFFFFSTANPTIRNAGFLQESKKEIYDLIPQSLYPRTLFFRKGELISQVLEQLAAHGMKLPLIGKPDIGMQGIAVKKLITEADLLDYAGNSRVDYLLQEFIAYEKEVGIFYFRYPNEERGTISGIVQKEFLAVTGNGRSTVEELLKQDKRFILQIKTLRITHEKDFHRILPEAEQLVLVPYGNHVRGARFLDISHLADDSLLTVIDKACQQVNGFYFGRMDIRYKDWQEFCNGKNFSIIELNGAGSEPTHIYDPGHSIFFAWKEIIRHLNILARISRMIHRSHGLPYMKFADGLKMIRDNNRYVKLLRHPTGRPT